MNAVKTYLMTVVAGALVCALIQALCGGRGTAGKLASLCCGVFLLLCAFSPLLHLELPALGEVWLPYRQEAQAVTAQAEKQAKAQTAALIVRRAEAYISDRAAALGTEVSVRVELDETGLPCGAEITGAVSPYVKARLCDLLKSDLGLDPEALRWRT